MNRDMIKQTVVNCGLSQDTNHCDAPTAENRGIRPRIEIEAANAISACSE